MLYKLILFIINIIKTLYSIIIFITFLLLQKFNLIEKFLTTFNVYGNIEGLDKYYHFKKNNTKGLAIFNHISILDGLVLLKEFNEPISFLVSDNIFVSLCKKFIEKSNGIIINKNEKTTQKITYISTNRKQNDPILFIGPSGGNGMYQQTKLKLPEFKTGAFVGLTPILPVIIKYNSYFIEPVDKIETLIYIITNIKDLNYKIKIMDPIYPRENETVESFKNYVYEKMNTEKNKLKVDKIQKKEDHIFLFILINILLLLSYLLYTNTIHYSHFILITIVCCIILYFKNTPYIYDYLYSNIIYFNTIIILIYSLQTSNIMLFIQTLLCIILYKLCQK
tara:strand:- start:23 stop:1030 length:1008 start_codon:yes stop_codon:yes gene_type:complete